MPFIFYSAVTTQGDLIRGSGCYADVASLYRTLADRGDELNRYVVLPETLGRMVQPLRGKPSIFELAELCRRLSSYLDAGLEIQAAIDDMMTSAPNAPLKRTLDAMQGYLRNGYRPSEAMRRAGGIPELIVNLARIGEDSGQLARTLADAARYLDRARAIKSAAKRGLIYPGFTLTALVVGIAFWTLFVVPRMVALFESMQMTLPTATRWLIRLSDGLANDWPIIVVVMGTLAMGLVIGMGRNPALKLAADRITWHLPIVGAPLRSIQNAFFFQYLSLLYGSGVPITRALESAAGSVGNQWLRRGIVAIQTALHDGHSLAGSFARSGLFPPEVSRMLSVGEQSGQLQQQLSRLAEIHFQRVEAAVETADKLLEPLIIAMVAVLFGFFALALFGPLYDLIGGVGAMG